jgi:acetyl-CoA carboxylase biotin carboxyl carrier protein
MASSEGGSGEIFNVQRIRRLIELMNEHDLGEIDLRQGDQRIKIRRGREPVMGMVQMPAAAAPPMAAPSSAVAPPPAAAVPDDPSVAIIKSPMVGTFYAALSPDSPPCVKVGDHVNENTTVCVIEAMKVFSEIPAKVTGQVIAVLVENGEPIEFGQPLFKVDTRK